MLTGRRWANARNKYFEYLKSQCQHINPRGIALNENTVTLPLDAVYVSLRAERKAIHSLEPVILDANFVAVGSLSAPIGSAISEASTQIHIGELGPVNMHIDIRKLEQDDRQRQVRAARQAEMVTRKMELYEVVQRERLAVLLGAPGAGKTTLTRFVTVRFAEACRDNLPQVTDKPGNRYGETRLPILLRVATYAEALDNDHTLSLREFLSQPFHDTGIPDAERTAFFEAALEQGKALVLLDGLDEVKSGADRAHIARQIESFVSGLDARCRVLVTSRVVGYKEARLGGAFAEYEMLDMDDAQVREFLNRWCVEVERFQTPNADKAEIERKGQEESGRLQQAITRSEGVRKLATNPLLLTILALIHRTQKHLPERRVELYRMASDTLLREWRPAQTGMKGVEVTEAEAETLLLPLAYEMHNTVETGLLDREDARKLLCQFDAVPRSLSPKDPAVKERVDGFLKRVEEHSGLLVMHSTGMVGFLHLTFQEYFAARYLVNDFDDAKDLLRRHRHKARWEEPLRLAIATQTGANAAKLIRAALWHKDGANATTGYVPYAHEAVLRRDLLLTARCLGDCAAIEPTLSREIADELIAVCLNRNGKGDYEPVRKRVLAALPGLATSEIGQAMQHQLLAALQDNNVNVRGSAASALGQVGQGSERVLAALLAALQDKDEYVRWSAASALGQVGQGSEAVLTALLAALQDNNVNVRQSAASALGQVGQGSEVVLTALLDALKDEQWYVRWSAASALGQVGQGSEAVLTALLAALQDKDEYVRRSAASALGQVGQGSEAALTALLDALKDEQWYVRWSAASALGQVGQGSEAVLTALLAALQDKDEYVRRSAASALGQVGQGSEAALTALLAALKDEDEDVRWSAASALGQVGQGSEVVLTALLDALKDEQWTVRRSAASALGQVGQGSEVVLTALLDALQDNNGSVRNAAWEAVWTLTSDRTVGSAAASE